MQFVKTMAEVSPVGLSSCYQCGTCTAVCPMNIPVRKILRGAQTGIRELAVSDVLWLCATCKQCEVACPRGVDITGVIHSLRGVSYRDRKAPSRLESALWRVYEEGTAWEGRKGERSKWAAGLNVGIGRAAKHLLYLDDAASFDPRLQRIARSLVSIFNGAGVDFTILGENEKSSGDEVYQIGEDAFLEELVQSNTKMFKNLGVEDIITVSPHSNNMFRNVYPKFGELPPSFHYTEFLSELLDHGLIRSASREGNGSIVTYHDPCYLGRYGGIYEEPRKILESICGVELTEMDDNRGDALCCGGGGGGMYVESESERPSHKRVSQADEVGASVLVTACPFCILNFEDGAKTVGSRIMVRDVAEVLADRAEGRV